MKIDQLAPRAILTELGQRIRRERLNLDITRKDLAQRAGISVKTIQKIEGGENSSMQSWLALFRALGILERFDALLPDVGPSPVQLARSRGKERQRASGRHASDTDEPGDWQW